MFNIFNKTVGFILIFLLLFLSISSISASCDILEEYHHDPIEIDEANVDNNLNPIDLDDSEGNNLSYSYENECSNQSKETNGLLSENTGTYESTTVKYCPLTMEYTQGNIIFPVKAYDIVKYNDTTYNQPKYGSIIKLKVYTGNNFKYYHNRIGNDGLASVKIPNLSLGSHN